MKTEEKNLQKKIKKYQNSLKKPMKKKVFENLLN